MKLPILALASLMLTSTAALGGQGPRIVATVGMIGEPMSRIVEPCGSVETLLGEAVDPHLHKLTRTQVATLARADAILKVGQNLEAQMRGPIGRMAASKPVVALADTLEPGQLLAWDEDPHYADPHVWMDPDRWAEALSVTTEALAAHWPDCADDWRAALAGEREGLAELAAYAEQAIASIPEEHRVLVTAHDAFGYFGDRFGIEVMAVQGISTESEAGLREVEALVSTLVERQIPAVFVETSVSQRFVRALIEGAEARGHKLRLGGELFSDAMGPPGSYEGTYLGMIDHNATTIALALGGDAPPRGLHGRLTGVLDASR